MSGHRGLVARTVARQMSEVVQIATSPSGSFGRAASAVTSVDQGGSRSHNPVHSRDQCICSLVSQRNVAWFRQCRRWVRVRLCIRVFYGQRSLYIWDYTKFTRQSEDSSEGELFDMHGSAFTVARHICGKAGRLCDIEQIAQARLTFLNRCGFLNWCGEDPICPPINGESSCWAQRAGESMASRSPTGISFLRESDGSSQTSHHFAFTDGDIFC